MGLRIYNKPVDLDLMGGYMLDIQPKGVYADLKHGVKHLGAPFGAVSWTSPDWDFILPAEKKHRSDLLALLKSKLKADKNAQKST